jgi:hypothetical protein
MEIILNGRDLEAISAATQAAIAASVDTPGLVRISAGNYVGRLGKSFIYLRPKCSSLVCHGDHAGRRYLATMTDTDEPPNDAETLSERQHFVTQPDVRGTLLTSKYLDSAPGDVSGKACSERLRDGLFPGEPASEIARTYRGRVCLFSLG